MHNEYPLWLGMGFLKEALSAWSDHVRRVAVLTEFLQNCDLYCCPANLSIQLHRTQCVCSDHYNALAQHEIVGTVKQAVVDTCVLQNSARNHTNSLQRWEAVDAHCAMRVATYRYPRQPTGRVRVATVGIDPDTRSDGYGVI